MVKRRSAVASTPITKLVEPPRHKLPITAEQRATMPFVYADGRIIAPWPKGPLHFLDEARLLTVIALVDRIQPTEVVWLWPDPTRGPVPIEAEWIDLWLARYEECRAVYTTTRRRAA